MNAEFSKLSAVVLASPYFSLDRYDGDKEDRDAVVDYSESRWAEKQELFKAVTADGTESAEDITGNAKAIWDKAYDAMMAVGHIRQRAGESDDEYDSRDRMEEPLTGGRVIQPGDEDEDEDYDEDADLDAA